MRHRRAANYVKAQRRKSGLTQRELGKLLGYKDPGQVSRHERAESVPSLEAALAYEVIFRMPVAVIFLGIREAIARDVETRLSDLALTLRERGTADQDPKVHGQKVAWLRGRQKQGITN